MSAQDNASTPNYVFGAGDVMSFLDAKLLGAPAGRVDQFDAGPARRVHR